MDTLHKKINVVIQVTSSIPPYTRSFANPPSHVKISIVGASVRECLKVCEKVLDGHSGITVLLQVINNLERQNQPMETIASSVRRLNERGNKVILV